MKRKNGMMKVVVAVIMVMAMLFTGLSLAESAAAPTSTPEVTETQSGGLFGWIGRGWNTVVTSVKSGWNTVTGAVTSGWNTVTGAIKSGWQTITGAAKSGVESVTKSLTESEWYRTVEDFITKNSATVSDAVVQGWNTIKEGAVNIGSVAWEKMEEAYRTIVNWFSQNHPEKQEEITEALDNMMQQLRVEYQKAGH